MEAGTSMEVGETSKKQEVIIIKVKLERGISVVEILLRVFGAITTLASAIAMATTKQTLPFTIQSFQFRAVYNDFPIFKFFVIANSIVCAYLVLSLPLSIFHMIRIKNTKITRIILLIFDMVMVVTVTSGAAGATSVVQIAEKGNIKANWVAICQPFRFKSFCHRLSSSLVASFISIPILMLIIIASIVSLSLL